MLIDRDKTKNKHYEQTLSFSEQMAPDKIGGVN